MNKLTAYADVTARIVADFETGKRFVVKALAEGDGLVNPATLVAFQKAQAAFEVAQTVNYLFDSAPDELADFDAVCGHVQAWIQRELLYPSTGRFASTELDRVEALRLYARLAI